MLTQPPALSITSIAITNSITCFGGANGSATVIVAGGTPIYTYQWYSDPGFTTPIVGQVTNVATGLAAGTYWVKITDFNGCWISSNITLTQPPILSASLTPTNITCFGANDGTITVSGATGGAGTYEFTVNGGGLWRLHPALQRLLPEHITL